MFGIYLMCQFHWELGIWRCHCVEMMRGIGGEGFFFHFRISPEYRRKYLSCLALSCLVAPAATVATITAGSAGPVAAVTAYLPTTELCAPQGAQTAVVTGRAIGVATALRAWGQRPTLALSAIIWIVFVLTPVSLVGRFTLTGVVVKFASVKLASHCIFQQT